MCGLVLLSGPRARQRVDRCTGNIRHRGPDDIGYYKDSQLSLGFARLAINDKSEQGKQPFRYGKLVSAINGEIFNAFELRQQYDLSLTSDNDCHVIPALFRCLNENILSELDGFFAGVIYNTATQTLYTLRDFMGKKPLFLGRSGSEVFITSELKALDDIIDSFQEIPSGFCSINLKEGSFTKLMDHQLAPVAEERPDHEHHDRETLKSLVTQAVHKRLPCADEPVGVFLSGGLDSSIIASIVSKKRPDAHFYCLASKDSNDFQFARELIDHLGIKNVSFIGKPEVCDLKKLLPEIVKATESYNPSIISNGLCTYLLAEAAHQDGIKVVLSGEGADELFCGYHCFNENDGWRAVRRQLIQDMHFTELRRVDMSCMAHAIEVRCPFLDREVYSYAESLGYSDHYHKKDGRFVNKFALRKAFNGSLPKIITWRKKTSFDVGSGVRGMVVDYLRSHDSSERESLQKIWNGIYSRRFSNPALLTHPYFYAYPVFDQAINTRGALHR